MDELLNKKVYRILKARIIKRDLKLREELLEEKIRKIRLLLNACRGIVVTGLLYLVLS